MHLVSIFSKRFNKESVTFLRVWTKPQIIGNIAKVYEDFQKISYENCEQCFILASLSKELAYHPLLLSREKHNLLDILRTF